MALFAILLSSCVVYRAASVNLEKTASGFDGHSVLEVGSSDVHCRAITLHEAYDRIAWCARSQERPKA